MSNRLPLNNQQIVRPLVQRVADLLESNRDRINLSLNKYLAPGGGPEYLRNIYVGRRPSRNLQNTPNITIVSTTRSAQWEAHRQSRVTVTLRIFCNVQVQDDDYHEYMMQDLADVVESILMQNPILVWEGMSGDPPSPTLFTTHTCAVAGVAYGTVDQGMLKAAQIDWGCEFLLPWNNINYVTDAGVNTSPAAILFTQHPSPTAVAGVPLATQPIAALKNDLGQQVAGLVASNISLSIKEGTGTVGASLSGVTSPEKQTGYAFYSGIAIDTPGSGYVLQASYDTGNDEILTAESTPIDVYPNPAKCVIAVPDNPSADTPFTLLAQAADRDDNSAYGFSEMGALVLDGTLAQTAVFDHGVAAFPGITLPAGEHTASCVTRGLQAVEATFTVA